jgi:uncharacterized membrane protein YgcG
VRVPGIAALLVTVAASVATGAEQVRSFGATITVERHDAFTVEETIVYDFGAAARHGVFRRIPVRYGRGHAADYRIGLDVEAVDDGGGVPRPFRVTHEGSDVVVRIGDPDRTVTGTQRYRLRYRVTRGLLYFEDHDELYWNVTGTGWPVPITRAAATVILPAASEPVVLRLGCFTGPQGAVARECRIGSDAAGRRVDATTSGGLAAGEGLSIVVGLPKGVVAEPSKAARLWARATDWLTWLSPLPLVTLAGMIVLWRRHGRDAPAGAAVPVRYEPPAGMSPAEMGTLVDEKAHPADLTATVLDLAVRGHLEIVEEEATGFLFLNARDYELVRRSSSEPLRPFERTLLQALFGGEQRVRVSSLRNRFYRHLPPLQEALYDLATEAGWFRSSPERVRRRWRLAGLLVLGAAVPAFMATESLATAVPVALTGLVILAFSPVMPGRTTAGRRAYEEILGFKEFLGRVDRDRLERSGGRTADRFERVLPYAVVLGVADQWADAFADVYARPPTWYSGSSGPFDSRRFVSNVGRSLQTMGTTMTSQPSGSGSSGFSSGGGSSGGGFGGGGGGSW